MGITPWVGRVLVSFLTQDLLKELTQQLLTGLLGLGRQAFPEADWSGVPEGALSNPGARALAGLLHGGLLAGWSRQQ